MSDKFTGDIIFVLVRMGHSGMHISAQNAAGRGGIQHRATIVGETAHWPHCEKQSESLHALSFLCWHEFLFAQDLTAFLNHVKAVDVQILQLIDLPT